MKGSATTDGYEERCPRGFSCAVRDELFKRLSPEAGRLPEKQRRFRLCECFLDATFLTGRTEMASGARRRAEGLRV